MNWKDILIGLILLAGLAGLIYYWQTPPAQPENLRVPQTLSIEDEIERAFNIQVPDDVDKAELKSTDGSSSSGLATRKFENSRFELTILADLPENDSSRFYKAWIQRGETNSEGYSLLPIGRLHLAKGGFLVDYSANVDYSDHLKILVSRESKDDDLLEDLILQGSF